MTDLIKKNSFYEVKNTSKTTMEVSGNTTIKEDLIIDNLYLSFSEKNRALGNVSYREYNGGTSYNYNIIDESRKSEIMTLTDEVISDIKTQLTLK